MVSQDFLDLSAIRIRFGRFLVCGPRTPFLLDRFSRTRVPYRNSWLRTFVSGPCGIGGVCVKPFSCARDSRRTSGAAFAGLIVCRLCMSLGVDTTRFFEGRTWLVTHEPLKIGSYVVRVRRNRTKGRYVRDVKLVTHRGFPRRRKFEDVEFPLEHRSSRTRCIVR